jgi:hypothetical protein
MKWQYNLYLLFLICWPGRLYPANSWIFVAGNWLNTLPFRENMAVNTDQLCNPRRLFPAKFLGCKKDNKFP